MFGACVQVPRQEDFGVDLYCTLFSDRIGQRVWPEAYYSVQVKSDEASITLPRRESVEWIVEYPAPLFHCIVSKADGLIRIYQTFARFGAAVAETLPDQLQLVPEGRPAGSTGPYGFDDATKIYTLGVPILRFKVEELLDDDSFEKYRALLRFWVLKDQENVRRYQMGMRTLYVPWEIVTNELPRGNDSTLSLFVAKPEVRAKAEESLDLLLEWLLGPWMKDNENLAAVLGALLLRQRGVLSIGSAVLVHQLRQTTNIDRLLGVNSEDDLETVLDKLLALLNDHLKPTGA